MTRRGTPPVFAALGDAAILITLGDSIGRDGNSLVHAHVAALKDAALPAVIDIVPAFASFAVHYDAASVDHREITAQVRRIIAAAPATPPKKEDARLVKIPVRYDGVDLPAVATTTGLSIDEVIARHSGVEYFAYMLGFTPGFAYLGDLDPTLHVPRRESPRTRVPAGSVAIAGAQTAVYPLETPGGWHIIGSTDVHMFDVTREPPALLRAGDRVRFEPTP